MATNKNVWIRNHYGAQKPMVIKGRFQSGATQAVKYGEPLEFNGTNWVPLATDKSMAAVVGFSGSEIKDGDRAGYYPVIVPRPGDEFRGTLDAASAAALGASLYVSGAQEFSLSGSNVLGDVISDDHYPPLQGHTADDASPDAGTTIKSTAEVGFTVKASVSYFAALQS